MGRVGHASTIGRIGRQRGRPPIGCDRSRLGSTISRSGRLSGEFGLLNGWPVTAGDSEHHDGEHRQQLRRGGESKDDASAGAGLLFNRSVELLGQDTDDAQAERLVCAAKGTDRQADTIVFNG